MLFLKDGAEYDEYGNRKQYQQNQARSKIPRDYNRRGYLEEQQFEQQQQNPRPRPVYPNPSPKRTIDTKRKAVSTHLTNFKWISEKTMSYSSVPNTPGAHT